jgi:hypothetical protein
VALIDNHLIERRWMKPDVMPGERVGIADDAVTFGERRLQRQLSRVRVTFEPTAIIAHNEELVCIARLCAGHETGPVLTPLLH